MTLIFVKHFKAATANKATLSVLLSVCSLRVGVSRLSEVLFLTQKMSLLKVKIS